jgi:phosphoserine phosphatase RsbU/P
MNILIAEDDPVASKVLEFTLERLGHNVTVSVSGREAWEVFDANPSRVVVSDWMMPDMDGLELCKRIRLRADTEYAYFILLTAINPDKDNYRRAIAAGIDDFLTKPLDRDNILMRLHVAKRILEYTKQIRQLQSLLPTCMYCHRIRESETHWEPLESYIHRHTGSSFSHGVCPECLAKEFPAAVQ